MKTNDPTLDRYLNGEYAAKNPDWDSGDSAWKAGKVIDLLNSHSLFPDSMVEIGCGSGAVLSALADKNICNKLEGYDISPDAELFWQPHRDKGIRLQVADYLSLNVQSAPDVTLVLDVLEHLGNPWEFLTALRSRCQYAVFHFPLDLSVVSVLREKPLLHVRHKVGHLHYYTKSLAIELIEESGFKVLDAKYTNAFADAPNRSFKTKVASALRKLIFLINHDMGARLLGGETLMILAVPADKK